MEKSKQLGIYMHVPFCARACDFCAFYQEPPRRGDLERYLLGMERELELQQLPLHDEVTVFWGGGTPGLLPARDLEQLGSALLNRLTQRPIEWTVEMAPSTVKADKLKALKDLGVTRISMGVQSFDERLLESLGRLHTVRQVQEAVEQVFAAGFTNLNLDLMFALPGQSVEQSLQDLQAAVSLCPSHISTYCLTFEEDTALWVRLTRGQVSKKTETDEAEFYEAVWDFLETTGYGQYEVSNFAKPGSACLHNINTWRMQEWIGFGPSASSQAGMKRWTNVPDLDQWLAGIKSSRLARIDQVSLDDTTLATDALIFGLRMTRGVSLDNLQSRFPSFNWKGCQELLASLCAEGLATEEDGNLRLTRRGLLLADSVGLSLLDVPASDSAA